MQITNDRSGPCDLWLGNLRPWDAARVGWPIFDEIHVDDYVVHLQDKVAVLVGEMSQ